MKIISEKSITDFEAWSGGLETKNRIIEADRENEFDSMIEDCYPDGLTDTQLNDLLWFESDWIYENLGISDDEEEEEEEEDQEEENEEE